MSFSSGGLRVFRRLAVRAAAAGRPGAIPRPALPMAMAGPAAAQFQFIARRGVPAGSRYLSDAAPAEDEGAAAEEEGGGKGGDGDGNGDGSSTLTGMAPIRFIKPTPKLAPMGFEKAIELCKEGAKWNETFELYIRVSTHDKNKKKGRPRDPFRGIVILPHAYKPAKQIVVLTNDESLGQAATEAGAVAVGDTGLIADIVSESLVCDTLLATPDILKLLKPYGRDLGRRMPSVKRGTVSENIGSLVRQYIAGVPFKSDTHGNINLGLGKVEFTIEQLQANMGEIVKTVEENRLAPRGKFIQSITLSRTQGKAFPLELFQFGL